MLIKKKLIQQAVHVLRNLHEKYDGDSSRKKNLLEEESSLFVQVTLKKIPERKSIKMIKINLPHSLIKESKEVCLIMGDLDKKNHKAEIQPDILHYKQLLEKHGITCISEVMTLRQLRTDYRPYEAKQKLLAAYDLFLTDKKITECLPRVLGRHFFKKRKFPIQIDMQTANLKQQIEKAVSAKVFSITGHGNSCCSEIAYLDMDDAHIIDNVMEVAKTLSDQLPGSWDNVMGVYLKTSKSKSVPVYMSYGNSEEIDIKTEDDDNVVIDELNTMPNVKVIVYNDGRVKTRRLKDESDDEASKVVDSNPEELVESTQMEKSKALNKENNVEMVLSEPSNSEELKELGKKRKKSKALNKENNAEMVLLDPEPSNSEELKELDKKRKKSKALNKENHAEMVLLDPKPSNSEELKELDKKRKKSKALNKENNAALVLSDPEPSNSEELKELDKKRKKSKAKKKGSDAELMLLESSNKSKKSKTLEKEDDAESVLSDSEKVELESKKSITKKGSKAKSVLPDCDYFNCDKDKSLKNVKKIKNGIQILEKPFLNEFSPQIDLKQTNLEELVRKTKNSIKIQKKSTQKEIVPVPDDSGSGMNQSKRKKKMTDCSSEKEKTIEKNESKVSKRKRTESASSASADQIETEDNNEKQVQATKKRKIEGINMKRYNARKDSRKSKKRRRENTSHID